MRAMWLRWTTVCLLLVSLGSRAADGYAVQTHEQLIDLVWKSSIAPLLRTRYPSITDAQLAEAHAYAYGGSAIQDIGYYPFGNSLFSNLTHYVRTGDFVAILLRDARTPDELAFAVGAMAHYIGDVEGHSVAVNPSVAVEFPGLRRRYGSSVNYEQSPHAHIRTEFAFDIDEIGNERFAPIDYLEHFGLEVSTDLLARAFYDTYGLDLDTVMHVKRTKVYGYRFAVRRLIPRVAYAETLLHRHSFPPDVKDAEFLKLEAELKQSGLDNNWGPYRHKPGVGTHLLAGLILIVPKIGPASILGIKGPTPATEGLYIVSVNASTDLLRKQLARLTQPPSPDGASSGLHVRQSDLPNRDLDTGAAIRPGGYRLTDRTYAQLLERVTRNPQAGIPAGLREDLLAYYADPNAPIETRKYARKWARVQAELATLQQMQATPGI